MSFALPSAEVAADFKDALQDLKINSRPEISNLTIIAKENTEHAQAISRELENHIRSTRPEWKLPALYVLDSIVKNVGTPYTVYLGRNLYRTFMDAYTLMDMPTRKAMEGLLKTWKQPVPESMDTRPVFPSEVTRDIENALIKYRTVAIQQQALSQKQALHAVPARPMPATPWRNTPTPPQSTSRYTPSNDPRVRQAIPQQYGAQIPPTSTPPAQFPPGTNFQDRGASIDLDKLNSDIEKLISSARSEWALNPSDTGIQQKLKALFDLQTILKHQQLPPEQIRQIQDQVIQLSPAPAPSAPTSTSVPNSIPSFPSVLQQSATPVQPSSTPFSLSQFLAQNLPQQQPSSTPVSLPQILRQSVTPAQGSSTPVPAPPVYRPSVQPAPTPSNPPSLAQLLQQFGPAATPAAPTPVPAPPPPMSLAQLFSQPTATANPAGGADWLLNALRSQNLLGANNGTSVPPAPAPMSVSSIFPSTDPVDRSWSSSVRIENDVELTTASITKKSRPNLIAKLYEALPNQCATCGRRFETSAKGKEMKTRHMDWHFKVKDPDAAKRGVHRSWYINEREWIEFREQDDAAPAQASNGASDASGMLGVAKKETKDQYIHVPTDAALVHAPCPICQEKFEPQWLVDANDFVWMDAIKVNDKIYHATCWEEYSRGGGVGGGGGRNTPDSVLGKRKAEVSTNGLFKKTRAD
ncbi:hypothetical protein AOQ84DRAFT_376453 [Glonium stellatum]|uniref:CID domain-containing protein n=1 Tax=Glonium stellatum TaxID=574774 RepID=A0A8E2JT63_9PEZI|nr:hypothetical protein AOQ84DRAFT_376453 [Glonium stellatum]